uniref:Uncharacterized protein n=1 Tax=Arundo donax TaxID=35708 RepID=A0A0A9H6J5_ARUDO
MVTDTPHSDGQQRSSTLQLTSSLPHPNPSANCRCIFLEALLPSSHSDHL